MRLGRPRSPVPRADACLASTLCALKDEVRWRTPGLEPQPVPAHRRRRAVGGRAARPVPRARSSPSCSTRATSTTRRSSAYDRDGVIYAKDGGLMGIRCVFDERGRCKNGFVKGMTFKNIMDPVTNIALGARELAYYRNGGGVEKRGDARAWRRWPDGGEDQERALPPRHPRLLGALQPRLALHRQRPPPPLSPPCRGAILRPCQGAGPCRRPSWNRGRSRSSIAACARAPRTGRSSRATAPSARRSSRSAACAGARHHHAPSSIGNGRRLDSAPRS